MACLSFSFCMLTALHAAEEEVRIGLIGDSTVATTYGWGPAFAKQCKQNTKVLNYAKNGGTLKALTKNLSALLKEKPDYVLIQFGHNDMKRYDPTVYSDLLANYVSSAKDAGATVVVLSSVTRRSMTDEGNIQPRDINGRTLADYAKAARMVAEKKKTVFIDLNAISIAHHNEAGPEITASYNFKPEDKTHFSPKGAQVIADLIIHELASVLPELATHIK